MKSILEPSISFYVFQELQDGAVDKQNSPSYKSFIEIEFPELDSLLCNYAQFGGFCFNLLVVVVDQVASILLILSFRALNASRP